MFFPISPVIIKSHLFCTINFYSLSTAIVFLFLFTNLNYLSRVKSSLAQAEIFFALDFDLGHLIIMMT